MNVETRPDPMRCFRLVDHEPHVWKGRVREVWVTEEPTNWLVAPVRTFPTKQIGPWYSCRGHVDVEGGHW